MNPRTQESTADTKAPLPDCALPQSTTQSGFSGAGIPGSKGRKYTPEEIRKKLLDLGGRDVTLDQTAPSAFELPASGALPKSIADPQSKVSEIPEKKAAKYTREQWDQRLQALGVRDATLDQTAPRAFELPASGASPQSKELEAVRQP
jgi:hypothetical protein